MKTTKQQSNKLSLRKETILSLNDYQMSVAKGGADNTYQQESLTVLGIRRGNSLIVNIHHVESAVANIY